jgi:sarcosine oxidase, subunit beta
MARIVVAGGGAIGASVAYNLALLGAGDVVLAERNAIASGATAKAMGGVRQQFSTDAEVRLAQASIRFFEELGPPYFLQVGYMFVATTEAGLAELHARVERQRTLGVPVERADLPAGVRADDVLGAVVCRQDGVADPPAVTGELVRRAKALGVSILETTDEREIQRDVLVIACGPHSADVAARYGVELPIRPLRRQLLETSALDLPDDLPMVIEHETGFHFRRRGDRLVVAMGDPKPHWGWDETPDETLIPDRLQRLRHRFPAADAATIARAWAGLYDMTPDAHPIVGRVADGIFAACGFSGHGFMQSPAVGRVLAEEILGLDPSLDLSPFRLERFANGAILPEQVVL